MTARCSRRFVLKSLAAGLAVPAVLSAVGAAEQEKGKEFALPALPWKPDALAPVMSKETIDFHYGKHHAAYVTNLNKLVKGTEFEGMSLDEIIQKASGPVFNNAAQVWNHTFFWNCLTPKSGEPDEKLAAALTKTFGSMAKFKEKFTDTAVKLFGSGWAWLIQNKDGSLVIEGMSNAGTPVKEGRQPLLACDVWEHAYYIDYRNARPKFVEAFWTIVDWKNVGKRLA